MAWKKSIDVFADFFLRFFRIYEYAIGKTRILSETRALRRTGMAQMP
jgi:hypothetical protein